MGLYPTLGMANPWNLHWRDEALPNGFGNQRGLCTVNLEGCGESEVLLLRGSHTSTLILGPSAKAAV